MLFGMRDCAVCSGRYTPVTTNQRFCSRLCYRKRRVEHICGSCGRAFTSSSYVSRYCRLACRPKDVLAAQHRMQRASRRSVRHEEIAQARAERMLIGRTRTCIGCGVYFILSLSRHGLERYCESCQAMGGRRKSVAHGPLSLRCIHCGVSFENVMPNALYCSSACRRAVHRRTGAERLRRLGRYRVRRLRPRVLTLWGWTCYLCGHAIESSLSGSHPRGLTLDHMTPLAIGGPDTVENLRPAHRQCNEEKSDDLPTWWQLQRWGGHPPLTL